jgi:hypothetical protein
MSDEPEEKSNPDRWTSGPESIGRVGIAKKTIDYTKPSEQIRRAENAKALEEARKTK